MKDIFKPEDFHNLGQLTVEKIADRANSKIGELKIVYAAADLRTLISDGEEPCLTLEPLDGDELTVYYFTKPLKEEKEVYCEIGQTICRSDHISDELKDILLEMLEKAK